MRDGRLPGEKQAAGRTGGVGRQPSVDAGRVETVAAARKDPHLLTREELGQADGAFGGLSSSGVEGGDGKGTNRFLLEALVRLHVVVAVVVASTYAEAAEEATPAGAARHEAQANEADESAQKRRQDNHRIRVHRPIWRLAVTTSGRR